MAGLGVEVALGEGVWEVVVRGGDKLMSGVSGGGSEG